MEQLYRFPIKVEDRLRETSERATHKAITELWRRGYDVRGKTSEEAVRPKGSSWDNLKAVKCTRINELNRRR